MDRRAFIGSSVGIMAASASLPSLAQTSARREGLLSSSGLRWRHLSWPKGFEGQRKADLGNNRFLNPVFAGDHPDPALLRVGDTFYLTFSSFEAYPGLLIWQSKDLINWTPVGPALFKNIGSVWAPALCQHNDRFYIYIPARTASYRSIYVIYADRIEGPWSDPIDLKLNAHIDPEHVADEAGQRWLFLSQGDRVALSPDGLATQGNVERIYNPWRYPDHWTVESFAPEGPKITKRGEYWYMITAVGGTAGPPTGHMVIMARAKSLQGPWEDCPHNPIVRTWSAEEKWWSRGHATLFQVPDGSWWMAYHGYENGFWTLGRQMLLEPVTWSRDGWPIAQGGDLSRPLRKPIKGLPTAHGQMLSDTFTTNRLGTLWSFSDAAVSENSRFLITSNGLQLSGKGTTPSDSSPLSLVAGDLAYEFEARISLSDGAQAGLLLFYSKRLYAGLGFDQTGLILHRYGRQRRARPPNGLSRTLYIRIRNDHNIVTMHHSPDGRTWQKFDVQMEVSGYHHNTDGDFLSLRPSIYASGTGTATFHYFNYRAL